jgi:hypothetical protein
MYSYVNTAYFSSGNMCQVVMPSTATLLFSPHSVMQIEAMVIIDI